MSELDHSFREICADPMLDIITIVRSRGSGWQVSVKRAYRGHNVHHDADPVKALLAALTAPPLAPVTPKPPATVASPVQGVDDDLFG